MVTSGPIERDGKIALCENNSAGAEVSRNGRTYNFVNRGGVTLAWVDKDDVSFVLEVRKVCCGGKSRPRFYLANSAQVDFWENLG